MPTITKKIFFLKDEVIEDHKLDVIKQCSGGIELSLKIQKCVNSRMA